MSLSHRVKTVTGWHDDESSDKHGKTAPQHLRFAGRVAVSRFGMGERIYLDRRRGEVDLAGMVGRLPHDIWRGLGLRL